MASNGDVVSFEKLILKNKNIDDHPQLAEKLSTYLEAVAVDGHVPTEEIIDAIFDLAPSDDTAQAILGELVEELQEQGLALAIVSDGGEATGSVTVSENTTTATDVDAVDPQGDEIVYSIVAGADAALFEIDPATGALRFLDAPDFETPRDQDGDNNYAVVVQALDSASGQTDTQALSVVVADVNEAPALSGGTLAADEDGAVVALDLAPFADDDDDDDDGTTLSYAVTRAPGEGTATITGTTLTFDPGADFQDLAEGETRDVIVEVTATDAHGASAVADFAVTVTGTNDTPTLAAAQLDAVEDAPAIAFDLASLGDDIDSDDDGTTLTYTVAGAPAEGTASIDGTILSFDPGADFQDLAEGETRDVTVEVTATDRHGATATADYTVTMTGTNDAPTLAVGQLAANEDGAAVTLDLSTLGGDIDSDDDGTTLTYTVAGAPAEGTASIDGTILSFDPGADFQDLGTGETRDVNVEVTATDQHGATVVSTVTVEVSGVNDAPVAVDDVFVMDEDAYLIVDTRFLPLLNDYDPDGDPMSLGGLTGEFLISQLGAFGLSGNSIAFWPTPNASGTTYTDYILRDGGSQVDIGRITVIVNAVADAPVLTLTPPETTFPNETPILTTTGDILVGAFDGSGFDATRITESAGVLVDGQYTVIYAGLPYWNNFNLGLITSPDGETFTKYSDSQLIPQSDEPDWASFRMLAGDLLYEDGTYTLYFLGNDTNIQSQPQNRKGIGYATSTDGVNWTVDQDGIFVEQGGSEGFSVESVVKLNDTYFMYLWDHELGANTKMVATSADGINFGAPQPFMNDTPYVVVGAEAVDGRIVAVIEERMEIGPPAYHTAVSDDGLDFTLTGQIQFPDTFDADSYAVTDIFLDGDEVAILAAENVGNVNWNYANVNTVMTRLPVDAFLAATANGQVDQALALGLSAALTDADGSESLTLTLTGFPEGASFSYGEAFGDAWVISGAQGLNLSTLTMTPPAGWSGSFTLDVTARSTEASNGDFEETSASAVYTIAQGEPAPDGTAFSYHEDFNDGVLNGDPWTFYRRAGGEAGTSIQEHSGLLHILNDQTDNGGYARIDFANPIRNATLEMTEFQHSSNAYYLPATNLYLTDANGEAFFLQIAWYQTDYLNQNTADGQHPKLTWVDSNGEQVKLFADMPTSDLLDTWIDTTVAIDSDTGQVTVDLDGDGVLDFDLADARFEGAELTGVLLNAYGWWTGQYRQIDDFSVAGIVDEFIPPVEPEPNYAAFSYTEDFNDSVLNGDPWWYDGRGTDPNWAAVEERNGVLDIRTDKTDAGGQAHIDFVAPIRDATVSMTQLHHASNEYYIPSTNFHLTDSAGDDFTLTIRMFETAYLTQNTGDGTKPSLTWVDSEGETIRLFADTPTADLLDTWLDTELAIDSDAGRVTLDIDGDGVFEFDVTDARFQDAELTSVDMNAYGWWTGHYLQVDDFSVDGLVDELLLA